MRGGDKKVAPLERERQAAFESNFQAGGDTFSNVGNGFVAGDALADATGNGGAPGNPHTIFIPFNVVRNFIGSSLTPFPSLEISKIAHFPPSSGIADLQSASLPLTCTQPCELGYGMMHRRCWEPAASGLRTKRQGIRQGIR